MGIERYNQLKSVEQEDFRKIVNYLLNANYILGYNYNNKNKLRSPNRDYQFLVRNYDLFVSFFAIAGYRINRYDDFNVIAINNEYNENHLRLDKFTTMTLYFLRLVYDEYREKSPTSEVVYLTTETIIRKMIENGVITKKPPVSTIVDTFRILARHNIINRIDRSFEDLNATIVLLPTILYVISNEKISAIHNAVFQGANKESDGSEESVEMEV